ncbi:MAG: FAD-dependent monooxygenase [Pseudomonadota bacterium]
MTEHVHSQIISDDAAPEARRDAPHVLVAGPGYIGAIAALALANQGFRVTLVGTPDTARAAGDTRSTALFPEAVAFLSTLSDTLAEALDQHARPLKGIRILDRTTRFLRAPEVTFLAEEAGLSALADNMPNAALSAALAAAVDDHDGISRHNMTIARAEEIRDRVVLVGADGARIEGDLVVGADGRGSRVRETSGIRQTAWDYTQTAVTCRIMHSAPHEDISTEFHRRGGPLTTVPGVTDADASGPGYSSHLVWVERPEAAAGLARLDDAAFIETLGEELDGLLGTLHAVGPRGAYPIKGGTADPVASGRAFLVGEAAHVLPPIGAQGMNLGVRDVMGLADILRPLARSSKATGALPSDAVRAAVRAYVAERRGDIWFRTAAVDVLNRSLTTGLWPVRALRGAGLQAVAMVPALKRATMAAGFGARLPLPGSSR